MVRNAVRAARLVFDFQQDTLCVFRTTYGVAAVTIV
jgi:hypothetical protein